MKRRDFLWCTPALLATRAFSYESSTSVVAEYEYESVGHIGFYAENILTRRRLSWRADDRFVMCSTFKASLAALILRRVDHGQDRLDDILNDDK